MRIGVVPVMTEMWLQRRRGRKVGPAVVLEASEPHPFIALLGPAKGKSKFPRFPGTFDSGQLTNITTPPLATFYRLDVVQNAAVLDTTDDSPQKAEVKRQTQVLHRSSGASCDAGHGRLLRVLAARDVAFVSL